MRIRVVISAIGVVALAPLAHAAEPSGVRLDATSSSLDRDAATTDAPVAPAVPVAPAAPLAPVAPVANDGASSWSPTASWRPLGPSTYDEEAALAELLDMSATVATKSSAAVSRSP